MKNATHTMTADKYIAGTLCPIGTRVIIIRKSTGKIVHVQTEFGGHARVSLNILRTIETP